MNVVNEITSGNPKDMYVMVSRVCSSSIIKTANVYFQILNNGTKLECKINGVIRRHGRDFVTPDVTRRAKIQTNQCSVSYLKYRSLKFIKIMAISTRNC